MMVMVAGSSCWGGIRASLTGSQFPPCWTQVPLEKGPVCLSSISVCKDNRTTPRPPGKLPQSISLGPSATVGDNSLPHLVHQACLLSCQLGSNKLRGLQTLRDASKVPPHNVPRGRTPSQFDCAQAPMVPFPLTASLSP